jgi:ubiquinone/menaquinone biosynthesis C-methylase UbiE
VTRAFERPLRLPLPGQALYQSARIAAGYAFGRPAVHERILERVREHLQLTSRVRRALDVGCGAGRSTAALGALAHEVVGIDPSPAMLAHCRAVAPRARFAVAAAERVPFTADTFDVITAAGSINYADLELALREISRTLTRPGTFVVYDFSAGRRMADTPRLERWYAEFEERYPDAPGYALEVRAIPFERFGLFLEKYDELEVHVPMSFEAYVAYALSETRVERALTNGANEDRVREWCLDTLTGIFEGRPRGVIFDAYAGYIRRRR